VKADLEASINGGWTSRRNHRLTSLDAREKLFAQLFFFFQVIVTEFTDEETSMRAVKCRFRVNRKIAVVIVAVAFSGCSLNVDPASPAAIVIVSGQNQTAPTNTTLPVNLSVTVTTQFGQPLLNQTITWTVVSGGGTLDPATSVTTGSGLASTSFTTGTTAGTVKIQAKANGLPPVTFTVTVTP